MTATRQFAIILAYVAFWEINLSKRQQLKENGSRLQILGILSYFKLGFEMFLVS